MPSRSIIALVLPLVILLGLPALGQDQDQDQVQEAEARAQASERVSAFERPLVDHLINEHGIDPHDHVLDAEQRQSVREFFAGLDSVEMKLEALGMLYSRFVFVVPSDMVPSLVEPLLDDADERVQIAALNALSRNTQPGQRSHAQKLLELVESESAEMRLAASGPMCLSGHADYASAINRLLQDTDEQVRQVALFGWRQWQRNNRKTVLLPMTSDPDLDVAATAIEALYYGLPQPEPEDATRRSSFSFCLADTQRLRLHFTRLDTKSQQRFREAIELAEVPDEFVQAVLKD